ncbi:BRO1-like domain-containing protein [Polychytrium aggregatum]|uniref:BRO1-like domain-containing protein n=1 Tax=Polychytrium aggregatum TaxID=110093 RepID=UPI0022FDF6CF|nr:BRO1-like domain-containing protein [Polychytrium aggregatum]KAI9197132.1 BRO1-like domain-containing protein [Polychytrium aggregatum]
MSSVPAASLQIPMLSIPLKKTEDVDFVSPLKSAIRTTYQEDPDKFVQEIALFNRLRQDARSAGPDILGRDMLYRYHGQLELADLRFQFDQNGIKVKFPWHDAFSSEEIAQFSFAYERACIIFNLAAVCSSYAAAQNRFELVGLKTASNYFQTAAGLLDFIDKNFLHAPSKDMSNASVKTLVSLLLTQAQECFVEKLLSEGKSGNLVAKLAAHITHAYRSVLEGFSDESLEDQFPSNWTDIVTIKSKHYNALSHYHRALHSQSTAKHGEAVAYFIAAESLAKEAEKLAKKISSTGLSFIPFAKDSKSNDSSTAALANATKTLLATVTEKKTQAAKDNDVIYSEPVPSADVLPAIEKTCIVKITTFVDLFPNGEQETQRIIGKDIFQVLVPMAVHESSSIYSEEKAQILRSLQTKAEAALEETQASMDSLNVATVMATITKLTKNPNAVSVEVPPEVIEWSNNLKELHNGLKSDELLQSLSGTKKLVCDVLDESVKALDSEQIECENLRRQYGDLWTQSPSHSVAAKFRQEITQYRSLYEKALISDASWISVMDGVKADVDLLLQSVSDIEGALITHVATTVTSTQPPKPKEAPVNLLEVDIAPPPSQTPASGELGALGEQVLVDELNQLLAQIRNLKTAIKADLDELKQKVHNDDISQLLVQHKNKERELFDIELKKFKPYQDKISDNLRILGELVSKFQNSYQRLAFSGTLKQHQQRERVKLSLISKWRDSYTKRMAIEDGIRSGRQFYTDLLDRVMALSKNINEMVAQRAQERDRLVKQMAARSAQASQTVLKDQLARLSISSSPIQATPPWQGASLPSPSQGVPATASAQHGGYPPSVAAAGYSAFPPTSQAYGYAPAGVAQAPHNPYTPNPVQGFPPTAAPQAPRSYDQAPPVPARPGQPYGSTGAPAASQYQQYSGISAPPQQASPYGQPAPGAYGYGQPQAQQSGHYDQGATQRPYGWSGPSGALPAGPGYGSTQPAGPSGGYSTGMVS